MKIYQVYIQLRIILDDEQSPMERYKYSGRPPNDAFSFSSRMILLGFEKHDDREKDENTPCVLQSTRPPPEDCFGKDGAHLPI